MENSKPKSNLVKVAGLWMNDAKTAIKSAKIEKDVQITAGMRLIVLPNTKQHDRQPDYTLFLAPPEPIAQPGNFDDIPF